MKIKILLLFFCINCSLVYTQPELINEFRKQSIANDSLIKILKTESDNLKLINDKLKAKTDSINSLKASLVKLEKFKKEKKIIDDNFIRKNDSITLLIKQKQELIKVLNDEKSKHSQNLLSEKEKNKTECINNIANYYKGKKFDELIVFSTKKSIERDFKIIGENNQIKELLNELILYFEAKSLLENRFNKEEVNNKLNDLNKIMHESVALENLKIQLKNYENINEGLIDCLKYIINLDNNGSVKSDFRMDKEIIQLKLNKIQTKTTKFIFDNEFNFIIYPYLGNILTELIYRKVPNPDANINDLLKRVD